MVVLYETNVLSLISQRLDNYYQIKTNATVAIVRPESGGADSVAELNAAKFVESVPNVACIPCVLRQNLVIKKTTRPLFSSSNSQLWHYAKRRFSVTSNLRYMHGVLNVDKIKN